MENEEISKYLTEKMGFCWHEMGYNRGKRLCLKCGALHHLAYKRDFYKWDNFGLLWNWAIKQDWWVKFKDSFNHIGVFSVKTCIEDRLINPEAFAVAIYNYLKESE